MTSGSTTDPDPERFEQLMLAEEPSFEDLLACVFGVTDPVARVYDHLLSNPGSTVKELAREMGCDRSTMNRRLDRLREAGLASRDRDFLSVGGFAYRYEPTPLEETQELMHDTLDEWAAFMHRQIDAIDELESATADR